MGKRCNRYAMVVDKDLKIEIMLKEAPVSGSYGETSAESVLKFLKGA